MILAPTLTLNTPAGSRLDADAVAFAAASGATDVAALSDFVKGVKALGLWNNMVCWPLRSTQNAGTGTTAFSLGGLGTFNGTLTNGPSWTADGIDFVNASSQYINTSLSYDPAQLSTAFFTIVKPEVTYPAADSRAICGNRSSSGASMLIKINKGWQRSIIFDSVGGHNTATIDSQITTTFANTFHFAGSILDPSTRVFFNQANSITASATSVGGTVTSGLNSFQIGAQGNNGTPWEGLIAFCGIVRASSVSSSQLNSLRVLVTQTLGTGLGLP